MNSAVDSPSVRNFGLDLCRSLAILLVISGHALQHSSPWPLLSQTGFVGLFGVDLFFSLSGFLIGRILIKDVARWGPAYKAGLVQFWSHRWLRTLPLYYFYLLVSLNYDWRGPVELSAETRYLLFAQNFVWPMTEFYNLSWCLAVEEWFYLLFPLVLLFFQAFGQSHRRAIWLTIAAFVAGPLLARWILPSTMPFVGTFDESLRHIVLFRLDALGLGILVAALSVQTPDRFARLARAWPAFAGLIFFLLYATRIGYGPFAFARWLPPTYFLASAVAFAGMVPRFFMMRAPKSRYFNLCITWTSKLSFSLYLGHIPAFMLVIRLLQITNLHERIYPRAELVYPLFLFTAYVISFLTYQIVEQPVLRWRDRIAAGVLNF